MAQHEVEIRIGKDGQVKVHVKGAKGKACLEYAQWLTQVTPLIRPGGTFEVRTDHSGYFDWMLGEVAKVPELLEPVEQSRDLYAGHAAPQNLQIPEVTLFERLFIRDGIPIKKLLLKRV